MTAGIERALLARAHELADTTDLAGWITEIIGWARAARVDQAALAGLVTAVRLLDGDATTLFRAVRGRHQAGGRFGRDTELLEITAEAGDEIAAPGCGRRPAPAPGRRGTAAGPGRPGSRRPCTVRRVREAHRRTVPGVSPGESQRDRRGAKRPR